MGYGVFMGTTSKVILCLTAVLFHFPVLTFLLLYYSGPRKTVPQTDRSCLLTALNIHYM